MLSELLQKLESQHGIAPSQGQGILNTIVQHVKEKFPQVAGMLDNVLGSQVQSTGNTNGVQPNNGDASESSFEKLEDLAKSKLGGLFGG